MIQSPGFAIIKRAALMALEKPGHGPGDPKSGADEPFFCTKISGYKGQNEV